MFKSSFYKNLIDSSLNKKTFSMETCKDILVSEEAELLDLINAAYTVRKKFWKKDVNIHVINNVQNGYCAEDCKYCAQSKSASAKIVTYPMKSIDEIMHEAKEAYESGAYRYCLVFAGTGPSESRVKKLETIIKTIKEKYHLEVCVSPGIMSKTDLKKLKEAGLDRLNHNLNTAEKYYKNICSTHTYKARINTLNSASEIGLDVCSGVIIGMGESVTDVINMAMKFNELKNVKSIPVNFFMPVNKNVFKPAVDLTPEYCLRVLCLFRLLNPAAEIRAAAGRELYLKSMQVMCLYIVNSIFMNGYLNVTGSGILKDLQMIRDAGFNIKSDFKIKELIEKYFKSEKTDEIDSNIKIKKKSDLRRVSHKLI